MSVEDADDAAVSSINQAADTTVAASHSPDAPRSSSSAIPYFHQVDEQIVKMEKSAGCACAPRLNSRFALLNAAAPVCVTCAKPLFIFLIRYKFDPKFGMFACKEILPELIARFEALDEVPSPRSPAAAIHLNRCCTGRQRGGGRE